MEHFYTIQGEGAFQGQAAYFLRLGGCEVGCVWCDVKESWDANKHPETAISTMVEFAAQSGAPRVVVTGGEPVMYELTDLTSALQARNLHTNLETSGAYEITGTWSWICLSPKKFKAPVPSSFAVANELKVVIYHPSDFDWAESHAAKVGPECQLFLQPEWSREKEMLPLIIAYVKKFPQWRISLQTHKYMDIP